MYERNGSMFARPVTAANFMTGVEFDVSGPSDDLVFELTPHDIRAVASLEADQYVPEGAAPDAGTDRPPHRESCRDIKDAEIIRSHSRDKENKAARQKAKGYDVDDPVRKHRSNKRNLAAMVDAKSTRKSTRLKRQVATVTRYALGDEVEARWLVPGEQEAHPGWFDAEVTGVGISGNHYSLLFADGFAFGRQPADQMRPRSKS